MIINELEEMYEGGELPRPKNSSDELFRGATRGELSLDARYIIGLPIRRGARVARSPTYTVMEISGDVAICLPDGGGELVTIPISELVRI